MTRDTRPRSRDAAALALLALLTALTVLAACGGGGGAPAKQAAQQGKGIFDRICATCHAKDANGLPGLGRGLRNNEFTKRQSDQELVEFLKTGRPARSSKSTAPTA